MKPDYEYNWDRRKPVALPRWLMIVIGACVVTGAGILIWVWLTYP